MTLRLCLAVIYFCVFTLPACAQSMKVMSFNILSDNLEDPSEEWDDPVLPRRDRVAAIFAEEQPDLIGLQEVGSSTQYTDLINMLPNHDNYRVGWNAIFYRNDRFQLLDSGTIDYSTPDNRFLIWTKLLDLSTNQTFVMFDTHLSHNNSAYRLTQAADVQAAIVSIADQLPAVLTGDFNFVPYENIISQSIPQFQTITGREATLPDSRFLIDACAPLCGNPSGAGAPRRIDYVTNTDHYEVLDAERIDRLYDGRPPSDHPVITSVLEFTEVGVERRRWPVQNHMVVDLDTGSGLDGIGNAYLQGTGRAAWHVGTIDPSRISFGGLQGDAKYLMKFTVPESGSPAVNSAVLRIYVKDIVGSWPEGLSLMHSTTENDPQPFPRDYKRPYTDTGLDLVVSPGGENQYYEFDVTSFVQAEMASGDPSLITAFRLELDSGLIPEAGVEKAYWIDTQEFAPQLVINFVPEPTSLVLGYLGLSFIVVRRRS